MFPYEKLEVYKKAVNLNEQVYEFLKNNKSIPGYLKNQLGRSSLSILLNIAEGSGRFTDKDRKSFLVISRGSTFESAAIINFLHKTEDIPDDLRSHLYLEYDEISRMLFAMINNLEKKKL
jgi:four helix bundle protein